MIPPVARRFVAGETAAEALEHVRRLNGRGIRGMVNRLGTHHDDPDRIRADATAYRELVLDVAASDLRGSVSVKPSQIGLDRGRDAFEESLRSILEVAGPRDVVVWLDMEERTTTDATLDAYEAFAPAYGDGIGVCLQANLRRSPADLERVAGLPGRLRLVRGGAYDEPRSVAYRDRERMDRAYRDLLANAFASVDGGLAVATHDRAILEHATSLGERYDTAFEVQMLMGVRPDLQRELAREVAVSQYVPYGARWKRYALNRVTETGRARRFVRRALLESLRRSTTAGRRGSTPERRQSLHERQ